MLLFIINSKSLVLKNIEKLETIIERLKLKDFKVRHLFNNNSRRNYYVIKYDKKTLEDEIGKYNNYKQKSKTNLTVYINVIPEETALFEPKIVYLF